MKIGTEITPFEPDPDHTGVGKTVTASEYFRMAPIRFVAAFSNRQLVGVRLFYFVR